jgi:hypothetical protein
MSLITIRGATCPLWPLIWKAIRAHESVYTAVAQQAYQKDQIAMLRSFFKLWNPIYQEAMEIEARKANVSDERIRRLVKDFNAVRQAAWRIGLGKDESGTFYPKMDERTMRALRAYRTYGPIPQTVAGDTMSPPEEFLACCQACITKDNVLVLSCNLRGKPVRTSIDLKPIAAEVKEMIRRYHVHVLHGDMKQETIAGLGDWYRDSVRAAARIANAKAAKKLWKKVQEHHGVIEKGLTALGPYGQAAAIGIRTGMTVKKMLTKAKQGDPQAIEDVKTVAALASKGDPSADQVMKIMKAMNEMGKVRDEKTGTSVSGWLWNRPYRIAAISPDMALRGLYNLGLVS